LCSDCEFSKACTYIDMKREASRNRVVLMCQARALNSFEDVCKRGNYVLIDESFRELLAPLYKIDSADDVGKFVRLIEQAGKIATDDKRVVEWLELAKTTAETFLDRITTATEFSRIYPRRVVDDPGEPLDLVLRQALEVVVAPPADTLIALRGLLSGDLELGVDCYEKYVGRGQTATSRAIYARGRLGVPDGKIIDLSDATTSADECERLLGREVIRHCPDARLEDLHDVVQVPIETTAGTSSSARSPKGTAAKIMMGMALHPDKTRVGILGIKRHIDALRKDLNTGEFQLLPEEVWERIEMISHFGAGNDRGSNEWHTSCDMLIVIGTLRVSPEVIRAELFRSRRDDALLRDGEWDKSIRWTGKSLDGEYVVVDGMGYADRAYREVYDSLTLSTLKQAVGRSRSAVEDGVPCVCFTTEDMQLPIVPCGDLSPGAARSVLAVAELYDGAPVTPAQIEHHTERNRSQIRKELRRAVYAGWVARHDTLDGVCPSLHGSAVSRQGGALP